MANPVWESSYSGTLPKWLEDGYSEEPESNVVQFKPKVGKPKRRKRSTAEPDICSGYMFCASNTIKANLENMYKVECNSGATDFDWTDPITGATETMTWLEPPKFQYLEAGKWRAAVVLMRNF